MRARGTITGVDRLLNLVFGDLDGEGLDYR